MSILNMDCRCTLYLQIVNKMTDIKAVYDSNVDKFVMCLPMDDTLFIAKLSAQNLLPGDTYAQVTALSSQAKKASYFLDHVIKPALYIDDTSDFEKLLSVMQDSGYSHVKNLSCKIRSNLDDLSNSKSGIMRRYL